MAFINYGPGAESLVGTSENDFFRDGRMSSYTSQDTDVDRMDGGAGNDDFYIGIGTDQLVGGAGDFDRILNLESMAFRDGNAPFFEVTGNGLTADLRAGTYTVTFNRRDNDGSLTENWRSYNGTISGIEAVWGGAGPDRLFGSDFEFEFVTGVKGGESFAVSGSDFVDGRGGYDLLIYSQEAVFSDADLDVDARAGRWTTADGQVTEFRNIEAFQFLAGDDVFRGSDRDETIQYSGGFDNLFAGGGYDILDYINAPEGIILRLADGLVDIDSTTQQRISGFELYRGSGFRDVMIGDAEANHFIGFSGDDELFGLAGADTLTGFRGADQLDGGVGLDTVDYSLSYGGGGVDVRLNLGQARDTFGDIDTLTSIEIAIGTPQEDTMISGGTPDTFFGRAGADQLSGRGGNDTIYGGADNDTLWGGDNADLIYGGAGDDSIKGGHGIDEIFGGTQHDIIDSGDGEDKLYGGAGRDTLMGGAHKDRLSGGAGDDTLMGGPGEDELIGGLGKDDLRGGDNRDTLDGGLNGDKHYGGAGPDKINANPGNDLYDGGAGTVDALHLDQATQAGVQVDLAKGTMTGGGLGSNTVANIESVFGSNFADGMIGDGQTNRLYGFDGKDRLFGGGGNDKLLGGVGSDKLYGGAGNDLVDGDREFTDGGNRVGQGADILFGGPGNDTLKGGSGGDRLTGGDGNDRLDGEKGPDVLVGGPGKDVFVFSKGRDVAKDFIANDDILDLSGRSGGVAFADFDELINATTGGSGVRGDSTITKAGNVLVLEGLAKSILDEIDIIYA